MRFGIVSDLHCNRAALLHALELLGDVDQLICLGDSIDDCRFANEVVRLLKKREALTVLGNHEEAFLGAQGARARARPDIDPTLVEWLAACPEQRELRSGGKKLLIVHSTPWQPRGSYVFPHSPLLERFGDVDADFVLYGHTHQPLVRRVGRVLVVNPGSAGEARGSRNGTVLSCAVLDTISGEARIIEFPWLT